jgi:shikimate dehydrogenase
VTITGATTLCFTIACPVGHVRTPAAFNAVAERRGNDVVMAPLEVAGADLADVLRLMRHLPNVAGAVVTVPHKSAAAALCDTISERAAACAAVNVIRRTARGTLEGDMLDGVGLVTGLERAGHELQGRSVFLAGAGGAARAIAFAVAETGASRIAVYNRTQSRALTLAEQLRRRFPRMAASAVTNDVRGFDIIINATSLGLKPGDPTPVDVSCITPDQLVAEIVMQPERTALIEAAAAVGARIHLGRAMLDAQLDLIADYLTPPRG